MKPFSFIALSLLCLSASAQDCKEKVIQKLKSIDGWDVTITKGVTEKPENQRWVFTPEIEISFINKLLKGYQYHQLQLITSRTSV